ncbi:MAG: hypothetical protein RJA19_1588 [Bacteroidota bacterium]
MDRYANLGRMEREVTVVAPATVANWNVGFDGLGGALAAPSERLIVRQTPHRGEVRVRAIHGAAGLPLEADRNVAAVAAASLLRALGAPCGLELELFKEVAPGSGLGSSAASAAAAVVAVDELLGAGLRPDELLPFALDGEFLASDARNADNVAPALMGGLVLCPPQGTPVALPVPASWHLTLFHPQVTVRTADARRVLPAQVPLAQAVDAARWQGAFVAALFRGDDVTAAFALEDLYIGPARYGLIPHFDALRELAYGHGARAGGISGSGPSTFWVSFDPATAAAIAAAGDALYAAAGIPTHSYVTTLSPRGAHRTA